MGDVLGAAFDASSKALAVARSGSRHPILIYVNAAFRDLVGGPPEGAEEAPIDEVFRATAGVQLRRTIKRCFENGEVVRLRVTHARGETVVRLDAHVRPLTVDGSAFAFIQLDPVDDRLPLGTLGEASILAELGPLSRGLLFIRDVDSNRIRMSGHPLAKRLGFTHSEADGSACASLVHPDDLDRYARYMIDQRRLTDGEVARTTLRVHATDGEWVWINFRARVFTRADDGAIRTVIGVAADVSDTHTKAQVLAEAAAEVAHAELNERRRIGRELHDSTAQLLVAAQLNLGLLQKRAPQPASAQAALDAARAAIREAQREIRAFGYLLHPPSLDINGLDETLRAFAQGFAQRTGLKISFRGGPPPAGGRRLSKGAKLALLRIAQEALMNVYRHAGAKKAWVRLVRDRDHVMLEIEDDGVGLPSVADEASEGVGISGMRARATQLGGVFELLPGAAGGLLVRVRLPIDLRPPA
jgi:PAS domain S-box-containing protein